ncbi:MAG: energy transducer TonB [Candidatus Eisenbacteria bacterium]|nr:energy transducer TonB [Candidatus Eisenbacteria bacterium]
MSAVVARLDGYGASELKEAARRFMTAGATGSAAVSLALVLAALGALELARRLTPPTRSRVIVYPRWYEAPPIRVQKYTPEVPSRPASFTNGIAVPVPDATAPADHTLPSSEEIQRALDAVPGAVGASDRIVIAPPPEDASQQRTDTPYYDEPPMVSRAVMPRYPPLAKEAGIEGLVVLRVYVGADGKPQRVEIFKGVPVLNEAATEAVMQYRFKPALVNDHPVAAWVEVPIRFVMNGP